MEGELSKSHILLPENTLGHHLARPFFQAKPIGAINCTVLAKIIEPVYGGKFGPLTNGSYVPEVGAFSFYGMNHGMALIMNEFDIHEPLPPEEAAFVKRYVDYWSVESVRAFYYLFLIITREFRHGNTNSSKLGQMFGPAMKSFFDTIQGTGSSLACTRLFNMPPNVDLDTYTSAIEWGFTGMGHSGGFGGKPWAAIANCTRKFVTGEYSTEMMLDTIWTLSHNNGPIFNKGMFYSMYNKSLLMKILDVQRSGQIPQMIAGKESGEKPIPAQLLADMEWVCKRFKLEPKVDWHLVESLGALGTYTGAASPKYKPSAPPKPKTEGTPFYVMPGLSVTKIKMKRAA